MASFETYFQGLLKFFFKSHNKQLPSLRKLNESVYEFYSPPDGTNLNLEIIFFHGLEPEDCEMAYVETWTSLGICWPQTLLAKEFCRARILSVSYDSSIKRGPKQGNLDLSLIAENLVHDLIDDAKVAANPGVPVILVGKDFGGLVIKTICMEAKAQNRFTFLSNLGGICYYGTPHLGIENLPTAFNGALAERLAFGNTEIAKLASNFSNYRKNKWATMAIICLQESEKVPELVISEASQTYDVDEFYRPNEDIDTVCKTSNSFNVLIHFISRIERGKILLESSPDQGLTEEGVGFKTSLGFVNDARYVPMERTLAEVENALQRARIVILHGGPGSGKSSLAKYLALQFEAAAQQQGTDVAATYSAEQSDWLPNGVVYMMCGSGAETVTMQQELLRKLGIELSLQDNLIELKGAAKLEIMLRRALADHLSKLQFRVVVILDDVWDRDLVESLLVPEDRVRYLLTTQISTLWNAPDSKRVRMQDVTLEDARHILGNYANFDGGGISKDLQNLGDEIIAATGSNPLALATLGIVLHNRTIEHWQEVKDNLKEHVETKDYPPSSFGQRYPLSVDASMMFVMDLLDEDSNELEGHSPSHLDGIVGRGVPDQKDVEESATTFTTSDATLIPTNTKVDCETRSLVETPQSSVRDGKGSNLLEGFLTEVNNSGGDGYFLSKKWLLTLDEHEREALFLVLGRNGYLEIYETLTTVFYERTEEYVQVLSMYDDPSRAPENNDLCFRDENKVEPSDDGVTSSKIEQTSFSATKRDGDLFNSSKSTLSLDNKTQLVTGKMNEISPSDAPSILLEKGEMPLTYSTEMLKSLKMAVKDSSLYNYAVSTHWLSTLNDHQLEDLNSALSEAGYSELYKTSTTTYFERIQGRIKNCPTYETDTVGTSGRNDIGGDTESSGLFQGHGNSLADNHGSDVGGRDSLAVSEESSKAFTKCECPPQCLTVSIFDLNFLPPSQSPIELSTSSLQGAYVFNSSSRQRVGNCSVTFPKNRKGYVISTEVDKDISMTTVTFTTADGYVPSVENVSVNVSAGTSLTCCLRSDHDNKKIYIKFSTIRGEAKLGEPVDSEKALALGSVRTNVHACIVDSERVEDFEEISLSMEEEYTRCPWKRMLKGGVWLAPSAIKPQHSQFQSRTVELQCEVNKRAAADRRDCRREAHCLSFEGPPPVIIEGKIIGDLHQNSFLQVQIRYQVEIISFPKSSTPLRAGTPFVRTIRRVPQVFDFDCVLVMRTQNL